MDIKNHISCQSEHNPEPDIQISRSPTSPPPVVTAVASTASASTNAAATPPKTDQIYDHVHLVTEYVQQYRVSGFHPVHVGDKLRGGRYKIIRKLGYGSFSTVWLTRDYSENCYVAIKILQADITHKANEFKILSYINSARLRDENVNGNYVTTLLDEFQESGPNGTHSCLVFEVSGPNVGTAFEELQILNRSRNMVKEADDEKEGKKKGITEEDNEVPFQRLAQRVTHQTALGLEYLHGLGICHGDLQPGNILVNIPNIDTRNEKELEVNLDDPNISTPVKRLDGVQDEHAPRYLTTSQPLIDKVKMDDKIIVRITDFGGAFLSLDPPKKPITPLGLRAPEIILGHRPVDQSIDVWSLGCMIFELITLRPLFTLWSLNSTEQEVDDDHFSQMIEVLGPLPVDILSAWGRKDVYFKPNGEPIEDTGFPAVPLRELLLKEKPESMTVAEVDIVLSLLRQTLQYDPKKRPSIADVLAHPWYASMS